MSRTPSHLRREGREAYFLGGDPYQECQYKNEYDREDWIEGWNRESKEHQLTLEAESGDNCPSCYVHMCKEDSWEFCPYCGEAL